MRRETSPRRPCPTIPISQTPTTPRTASPRSRTPWATTSATLWTRSATQAYTYSGGTSLTRRHEGTFDALGRTLTDLDGWSTRWTFTYDPNGNTHTRKDGDNHTTTQVFDALNRLSTSTDANSGVTQFAYDAHDRPVTVTDPNTHATAYVYDGFGDVKQQTSPDSGTTVYHYDADGNLTSKTDALSVVTNYTYDALDRITHRSGGQWAYFSYDANTWNYGAGIGRLNWMSDASGVSYYGYDERGNVDFTQHTAGSQNIDTWISYDSANRLSQITYPSGLWVGYSHDAAGNISQVQMHAPGSSTYPTVAWPAYAPFGPLGYTTFGNSVAVALNPDQDYKPTIFQVIATSGNLTNQTYSYDVARNLTGVSDTVSSANNQTLGYDVLNRLTSATSGSGGYGSLAWAYDSNGNLTSQTVNSSTTTYGYTSGSNRLSSITHGGTVNVTTDANGNITSIPPANSSAAATFTYSGNRLTSVTGSPTAATFVYDGFGKRFSKTDSSSAPSYYTYDTSGNLIEENDNGVLTDYIYLGGIPIGVWVPGTSTLYYVQSDRLGTPQMVTNSSQSVVWSTTYQPYGTTPTPTGSITQNLRFPGQFADAETGFSYNGFRDYMPNLGRYPEADPIGLGGGLNPYLYASANPGMFTDPTGLACKSDYGPPCSGPNSDCELNTNGDTRRTRGTYADPDSPGNLLCSGCFLKSQSRRGTGNDVP